MDQRYLGLLLLFVAGAMNGSFTLPMKFTKKWAWENTWLAWTIFALLIFPLVVTFATVPSVRAVYADAGIGTVLIPAAFGAGWGISQVFLGLAVEGLGMALSFSVILGLSAAVGSLVPLIRLHPDAVLTRSGLTVLSGVLLVLVGVSIAAIAGRKREVAQNGNDGSSETRKISVGKGLIFATISGLGSALTNLGFVFGAAIKDVAVHHGASASGATNAVWLPLMLAGGIPNLLYCIYLMRKNKTGTKFAVAGTGTHWCLAAVMAFFWFGSTVMYGVAATKLGELGTILGWPLFMSLIVITATLWGVMTGEWKNSGKQPLRIMSSSVAVLVLAIFVLGFSSRLF